MNLQNIKKTKTNYYKVIYILTILVLGIFGILISDNIFKFQIFGVPLPIYARILSNLIYTTIIISLGIFLIFKNKINTWFFQMSIFILGILVTFAWIPTAELVKDNNGKVISSHYKWLWYKLDALVVFACYATLYFLSLVFVTNINIYKIKKQKEQKN
ncbi:hypothetical protein [Mycoplasmopsis gallopavonis]|uniref:Uncharacterized protein n=1 Tax=Mycoplasmopsis gallopavonis TaxID=76629 RepID=A0A449B008_9BACT|nr:hypothetical protein [Mycoplasmopsis gallopavonis]RIV16473.1 hypothetical protein D1113_02240 [Mycoplasmopsis gallopavonis]VEU73093.1 Uncharacterised protein [Mycoplasmopsis gallopavonis]